MAEKQVQVQNKLEVVKNFLKDLDLPIDVEAENGIIVIEANPKYVASAIYNDGNAHLLIRDRDSGDYETVLISLSNDGVYVYPMSKPSRTEKKELCSKYPDVCSKYEEKRLFAKLRVVEMMYNEDIIRVVAEVVNG